MNRILPVVAILQFAVFLGLVGVVPSSYAQDVLTLESPSPGILGRFGRVVEGIQDVDDDGHGDVVIGTVERVNDEPASGQAHIYSGATGNFLRSIPSPNPIDFGSFSETLADAGDVDGDGFGDILVGAIREHEDGSAFFRNGLAYLFSGADGGLLRTFVSPNAQSNGYFGSVAAVPDVLGDGLPEYLIGAAEEDAGGTFEAGRAYLFNSATGTVLHTLESLHPEASGRFGSFVAGVPDLTADGRGDLLVAAHNEAVGEFTNAGRLYVFDGASGGLVHEIVSPAPSENGSFGSYVAGTSDLSGDGRGDILVQQSGVVYVFSGATGTLLYTITSPGEGTAFGRDLIAVPDIDGDGLGDLLIADLSADVGEVQYAGRAYLFSGATGTLLETFESPNAVQNGGFGSAVAAVPSSRDLLIGASNEDSGALDAGRAYIFQRATPTSTELIVNDTRDLADADASDDVCDVDEGASDNQCTLRAAIETAKLRAGRDSVSFAITGNGPHTITLGSALPSLGQPLVIDATTQPGYAGKPVVILAGGGADGFTLNVGQTTIRGFAIGGYSGAGIRITGPGGNTVEACHIGVNAAGTAAVANGVGIVIESSPSNIIGGPLPILRNVISGNTGNGIEISGVGATGNVVAGNYIGTDASGAVALGNGNAINFSAGVRITDAPSNTVGGIVEAARNVISANGVGNFGSGVQIRGQEATGNIISANHIGTDVSGEMDLGNGAAGVQINGAPSTHIGGFSEPERNVVSGNGASGVLVQRGLDGAPSDGTQIQGNFIGVTAAGDAALGNGSTSAGVEVQFASNVTIGGMTGVPGQPPGNVISANSREGILVDGVVQDGNDNPSDNLRVLGNLIGLDATGETAMVNGSGVSDAITLKGAVRNALIGQVGGSNVIVADSRNGIMMRQLVAEFDGPNGAHIAANTIGLSASGDEALGENMTGGVVFDVRDEGGLENVTIGGTAAQGNRVVANSGFTVAGSESTGIVVSSNTIGLLANGEPANAEPVDLWGVATLLANGVTITDNTIGGQIFGVVLASNENVVHGNKIGTNTSGTSARPNLVGLFIPGSIVGDGGETQIGSRNVIGGSTSGEHSSNVISGNKFEGIRLGRPLNLGSSPIGSGHWNEAAAALRLAPMSLRQVGDMHGFTTRQLEESAVRIRRGGNTPDLNVIGFNRIGTNAAGTQEIGNGRGASIPEAAPGILIEDGIGNIVAGNVISGNGGGLLIIAGFSFDGHPEETVVAANQIGVSISGTPIPNQFGGIIINESNNNSLTSVSIMEGGEPVGNLIGSNGEFGVQIINLDDLGHYNTIRQSSFLLNDGPSIQFVNGDDAGTYPPLVPLPPRMLTAIAHEDQASARVSPGANGPVEVFSTTACAGGHAQGVYRLAVQGAANVPGTVLLGYEILAVPGAAEAVGLYISATSTTEGETGATSSLSNCLRIAAEENAAEVFIPDGQTGDVFDQFGLGVEIEENPAAGQILSRSRGTTTHSAHASGTLHAARYDLAPDNTSFEGSATSDDGSTIEPNAVASSRYWTLVEEGLEGITYKACVDITGVGGINVPGQLVLVQREHLGEPWTPFASTLDQDGARLCSAGLTEFGDLGIGADSLVNPLPVELTAFTAVANGMDVELVWKTASETNNSGFQVETNRDETWAGLGFVEGHGTTTEAQQYGFTVRDLMPGTHRFRLKQIDFDGAFEYSDEVEATIGVPTVFALSAAYPNPFNPSTVFRLDVPVAARVEVAVFDMLGRRVTMLVNGDMAAGSHALRFDAHDLPSGVYIVRAIGAGAQQTRSVTLLR